MRVAPKVGRDYDSLGDAIPDQEAPIPRLRQAGKSWGHLTDPGSAMLPRRESSDDWAMMPSRLPQSLGYQDVNLGVVQQVYPRSFTLSSGYEVDPTLRFGGCRDGELSPIRASAVVRSASPLTTVYSLPAQVYTRQPSPVTSVSTGLSVTRPAYIGPVEATSSYTQAQVAAPKSCSQGKYVSWSPGSCSATWTNYSSTDRAGECGRSEGALSSASATAGKQESIDHQGVPQKSSLPSVDSLASAPRPLPLSLGQPATMQAEAYPAVRYVAGLTDSQQLPTMPALGTTHTAAPLPCASVPTSAWTPCRSSFQRLHAGKQESIDHQGVPQKSSLPSVDSLASAPRPLPLSLGQPATMQAEAYPAVRYVAGLANSQQLPTMPALGTTHTAAPLPCATSLMASWAAQGAPVPTAQEASTRPLRQTGSFARRFDTARTGQVEGSHVRSISWSPCTVTDLPLPTASQDGWLAQSIPASDSPLPPRIGSVSPLKCLPAGCTRREWVPEAPRSLLQGSLSRCVSWSPDTMVVEPVPMESQALPYSKEPSDGWFAPNILASSSSSLPPRIGSVSPLKCMPAGYTRHEWDPEAKGQAPHPPTQIAVPQAASFPQLLAEARSRLQQKVDAAAALFDVYDATQPNAAVPTPMQAEGASCRSTLSPSPSSPATSPAPITSTKMPSSGLAKLKALLAESKVEEPAIRRPSDTLELSLKVLPKTEAIQSNLSGCPGTQTPLPPLPALPSRYFTPPRMTSDFLTLSKSESTGLDGPGEAKDFEGKTPCSVSSGTTVDPQRLLRMDQESELDLAAAQKPKVEFSQQPEMAATSATSQDSGLHLPTEPVTASCCQSRPSWTPPAPANEKGAPDLKPTRSQSVPTGLDLGQREVAEGDLLKEKDGDPSNPRGAGDIAGGWSHFKAKAALHASDLLERKGNVLAGKSVQSARQPVWVDTVATEPTMFGASAPLSRLTRSIKLRLECLCHISLNERSSLSLVDRAKGWMGSPFSVCEPPEGKQSAEYHTDALVYRPGSDVSPQRRQGGFLAPRAEVKVATAPRPVGHHSEAVAPTAPTAPIAAATAYAGPVEGVLLDARADGKGGGRRNDPNRKLRVEISELNYKMRNTWAVPTTRYFAFREVMKAQVIPVVKAPNVTFSKWSTADALLYFGSHRDVCALNFANGEQVGGGYKTGALAQEEDLCRRLPNLYTSLLNAKRDGLYPFGPPTCRSKDRPERYSDVLFTSDLVVARESEERRFEVLPREKQVRVSLVTAAAPNINFAKEVYDLDLMANTIRAIFLVPRMARPELDTLILGAWGCGAFGCNPQHVSDLFARAVVNEGLGNLYKEIHFAIPADANGTAFRETFAKVPFKEL
ncbi:PRCP [Symbiodinium sp. KB8]|nr:PRCP [Symbiodinium sp. KB8]